MTATQLPLPLPVEIDQRLDLFVGQDWAVACVAAMARGDDHALPALLLEGPGGSGKSHLLLAACHQAGTAGRPHRYLSLAAGEAALPGLIEELDAGILLAIDDLDAIADSVPGCEALFHLHNRARDAGSALLYASRRPAADRRWALPDLRSRLGQCLRIALLPQDEAGRREILRRRAWRRGLELDESVLDWLLRRVERDLHTLTALLDRLDAAALAAQRRLTVPFLRQVFGELP